MRVDAHIQNVRDAVAGFAPADDAARVGALLHAFANEQVAGLRRDLLRLAIDLFCINVGSHDDGAPRDVERNTAFDLIEIVEVSDPRHRLFVTRGLELKTHLEHYLLVRGFDETALDGQYALQLRRSVLRERADALLLRFGIGLACAA